MTTLALSPEALAALQQFRGFYRDLADIKRCLEGQRWGEIAALSSPDSVAVPADAAARAIFARLYRAITGLGFGARGRERGNGELPNVGYVMAALADEVLLHGPEWPGQETWSETLIEEALYGTRIAGERVFLAAHDLLAGRHASQAVAVSILLALMLGFRGRYHGIDDHGEIASLKERLFGAIFHLSYPAEVDFRSLLSEDAPRALAGASRRPLPAVHPWVMAILLLITLYIAGSDALWRQAVSPILGIADNIIRTSAPLTQ